MIRLIMLSVLLIYYNATAQDVLTLKRAEELAVQRSPMVQAAILEREGRAHLRKGAFNPDDPELLVESPTGDFMTVGVSQSFDFPTVYIKRGKLLRAEEELSARKEEVTLSEVKYMLRMAYLEHQYAVALLSVAYESDSAYAAIAQAASRLFNAGQIDYVASTYASVQYGNMHNKLSERIAGLNAAQFKLKILTGFNDTIVTEPLVPFTSNSLVEDSTFIFNSPTARFNEQKVVVADRSLQVERNKIFPGFTLGYLNPGGSEVDIPLRLRAGISVPLWFWNYSSSIRSAKKDAESSKQRSLAENEYILMQYHESLSDMEKYATSVRYYESRGNAELNELINSTQRMQKAGQISFIDYLRTMSEAFDLKLARLDAINNLNKSVINLNYITGK